MSLLIPLPVLLPLLGAAVNLMLARRARWQAIVTVLTLAATLAVNIVMLMWVDSEGPFVTAMGGWEAPIGIVLVVDRLAALMLVISSIVTLSVFVYAVGQELIDGGENTPLSIFNPAYLILCAGVFNAFMAGDLFNLYVGFEMLLVSSYVLMTLNATESRIRTGITYIVVSLMSSLIFLAAIGLIYGATGTVNMAQLGERIAELPPDVQTLLHAALLIGFGVKAAIFPLSFWLPDSYPTAPAPVTAVFAGLLTKVGIYAIIRAETVIFQGSDFGPILMAVAFLTMLVGILGAVAQPDIKRLLSFTLVSHIGYMLYGVAIGTVEGLAGAIYYTVHHITVQTTLFLVVGLVELRTGSTSTRRLGGLMVLAPVLSALFFIPAMNLAGIPPFSGFIGKLGLFQAGVADGGWENYALIGAGLATSLLTLYAVGRAWNFAFWRSPADALEPVPELVAEYKDKVKPRPGNPRAKSESITPRTMMVSTMAMVVVSLLLTLLAGPLYDIADRSARNIVGTDNYFSTVLGSTDRS